MTAYDDDHRLVDQLVRPDALQPVFQPIVALPDSAVVAFEALARWPGLDIMPTAAFAAAARTGRTYELDWACRTAALRSAVAADGLAGRALFVNVEPVAAGGTPPPEAVEAMEAADGHIQVVLELTERALLAAPAELMTSIGAARSRGYGIALDDVGVDPSSLALLPFIAPDVVKLDLSLLQRGMTAKRARVAAAVMAHAERTGATVLSEGIEEQEHVESAMALGATLGQGFHFGRPGPITAQPDPFTPVQLARPATKPYDTPYDLVRDRGDLRVGSKSLVLALTRHIEEQATAGTTRPVVLGAFQDGEHFAPRIRRKYAKIALRSAFVGAIGIGLNARPARGVVGADLAPSDPLCREWTIVVVGDHYAGAVIARDLGDDGPEDARRFEFAVTHDRETVLEAGRSLLTRLLP